MDRQDSSAYHNETGLRLLEDKDENLFIDDATEYESPEEDNIEIVSQETQSEQSFDDNADDDDIDEDDSDIDPTWSQPVPGPSKRLRYTSSRRGSSHTSPRTPPKPRVLAVLKAPDGTAWSTEPQNRTIDLPQCPPPVNASITSAAQNSSTPYKAWKLLINEAMINEIVVHTNEKLSQIRPHYSRERDVLPTNVIEIEAFIGLLYMIGLHNSGHVNIDDLWARDSTGIEFFHIVMNQNRFRILLQNVRFDSIDEGDRQCRLQMDKLTKIRNFFDPFVKNCQTYYIPSDRITVDEMLEKFRGRCAFRQYIKNKPAKYGIKIFGACDVKTSYTISLEIYCGQQPEGPRRQSTSPTEIVLRLVTSLNGSGRNITTDNWYTSYELARKLAEKKLTLIGTLRKNQRCIPKSFLREQEYKERFQSMFAFTSLATLVCYQSKNKKIVPLLSTLPQHNSIQVATDEQKKPNIILEYNQTKGGVDHVDRLKVDYQLARTSRRWPLTIFFALLNIAGINSHIIYRLNTNSNILRKQFLKELSFQLVSKYAKERSKNIHIRRELRSRIAEIFPEASTSTDSSTDPSATSSQADRREGRCFICSWRQNRPSKTACVNCSNFVCTEHRDVYCKKCSREKF